MDALESLTAEVNIHVAVLIAETFMFIMIVTSNIFVIFVYF